MFDRLQVLFNRLAGVVNPAPHVAIATARPYAALDKPACWRRGARSRQPALHPRKGALH